MEDDRKTHAQDLVEKDNKAKRIQDLRHGRERLLENQTDNFINQLEMQTSILKLDKNNYKGIVKDLYNDLTNHENGL
jgi:hypothetical protein